MAGYGGTVTFNTTYGSTFPLLSIAGDCIVSNGVWTHADNTTTEANRLCVAVGGNFHLAGTINLDSKGYSSANGPGRCTSAGDGGGASHGGQGRVAQSATVYGTYGSPTAPTTLGSGASQKGGGAVRLTVAGATMIAGSIYARGGTAASSWAGPGAGGSIWLTTSNLVGSGTLNADGGSHTTDSTGAGAGGGRIAVILTGVDGGFGSVAMTAYGGTAYGRTGWDGAAGTVYKETANDAAGRGELIVANASRSSDRVTDLAGTVYGGADPALTLEVGRLTFGANGRIGVGANDTLIVSNTVVTGYAASTGDGVQLSGKLLTKPAFGITNWYVDVRSASATFNAAERLTIGGNATYFVNVPFTNSGDVVIASGGNLSHQANGTTAAYKLNLTVLRNLTVESGGQVNADAKGYSNQPFGGGSGTYGASHGGRGGIYQTSSSGPTYGSIIAPVTLGSAAAGNGGGAIQLTVLGTTALAGNISANAFQNTEGSGCAGGSVFLVTSNLTGSASITANGGGCVYGDKGRGGGGRIAVVLTGATSFGNVAMTAYAGANNGGKGGAGTIYLRTKDQGATEGTLIVKGDANSTDYTDVSALVTGTSVGNVLILPSYGKLRVASQTLTVNGVWSNANSFTASTGGIVAFAGTNPGRLFGASTFQTLRCVEPAKQLFFQAGKVNAVQTALTLTGAAGNRLVLRSSSVGSLWGLNVAPAASQSISEVDVQDSDARYGNAVTALNVTDSLNNFNWVFSNPGQTNTWNGSVSSVWGVAGNWSLGRAPIPDDAKTIIPDGCSNYPVLDTARQVNELELDNGASLSLNNLNLTVLRAATIAGSLIASGSETVRFDGDVSFAGGSVTPAAFTLLIGGSAAQVVTAGGNAFATLRITNSTALVSFTDAVTTADLRSDSASLAFGGDLTVTGTYRAYSTTAARTHTFAGGSTVTIRDWVVSGAAGYPITMQSSGLSSWNLHVTRNAYVRNVAVSRSDADGGTTIYPITSTDNLNNANWVFDAAWRAWDGSASASFTDPANWTPEAAPGPESRIVIDGGYATAPVIASALTVRALTLGDDQTSALTANAALTVIEDITVGPRGTLTLNQSCVVSGDVAVVAGGLVTHSGNADIEVNRLTLTVQGDLVVDANAALDASSKGYAGGQGPGRPVSGQSAASHGGRGGGHLGESGPTYGSVLNPTTLGSGASMPGGGAVRVVVVGHAAIAGRIAADGGIPENGSGGAGGSIHLTAGSVSGSGTLSARGGGALTYTDKGDGGGGRIAIRLTSSDSFGDLTVTAVSVDGSGVNGAAGTIYRETPAQTDGRGTVTVDNGGQSTGQYTYLLPETAYQSTELQRAGVEVRNGGRMKLPRDTRVGDIHVYTGGLLELGDYDLYVNTPRHELGGGTTQSTGGEIIWAVRGTVVLLR